MAAMASTHAGDARRLALALPDVVEAAHFGKADFRVGGRIFATLPEPGRAVLKLTIEQQEMLAGSETEIFVPLRNAWGRKGWTAVHLDLCPEDVLRHGLQLAWGNIAGARRRAAIFPGRESG